MTPVAILVAALLVLGVGLQLIAALGLVAMRDTFARLHYPGVSGFGLAAIALAIFVREGFSMIGDKALATAALTLVAGPVLVHATARAARVRRLGGWRIQPGEKVEEVER
ncbi:MAG: monovalent cation/H(+) antiporter subunit G [Solirubrobacterales bacterium]